MRLFKKKFIYTAQLDAMDCGPACLQSIALYYGKKLDLEYLRDITYITREGVSLLAIAKAAEKIGFKTRGVKIKLDILSKQVKCPCILYWRQEHFVVLYDIKTSRGKRIYRIADPSVGKIDLDEESFSKAWLQSFEHFEEYGICLLLEPSISFHKSDERKKKISVSFLLTYIKPYRQYYLQLLIGLILGGVFQILFPFLTQSIVDKGIGHRDIQAIYLIIIGFLCFTICNSIISYIRSSLLLHISSRINISIISDFLCKMLSLSLGFFDKKFTGDLIQRIKDHDRIEAFLVSNLLDILYSTMSIIVFGTILFIFNKYIFLIFLTGSTAYIGWLSFFLKRRRIIDYKRFIVSSQNQSSVYQLINGVQDIKLNNCEIEKRWEWERIQIKLFKISIAGLRLEQLQTIGATLLNDIKNIGIVFFSAFLVIKGELSVGEMMAIQYINGQLNGPVSSVIQFIHSLQDAKISLERLGEIHLKKIENTPVVKLYKEELSNQNIYIHNVSFRYNDPYSPMILDNISLKIPVGKTTAIVGVSGTGKTTLLKLILGFYPPETGDIYVGTSNLKDIDLSRWRSVCGVVMQNGYIFNDTISNNICVNPDEFDEDRLYTVSKITNIYDFIINLPLKYDTRIGDDGIGLSQGQRQRILIARAIYKNPSYLFLDEATNSLDTKNENDIVSNLSTYFINKTKIIIAHRLSTIRNADQIVLIEAGRIKEIGTHRELIAQKGIYYNLVNKQL